MKTHQNRWQFATAVCSLLALGMASRCANKQNVAENEQVDGFSETAAQGTDTAATTDPVADTAEGTGDAASGEKAASDPAGAGSEAELFGQTDPNAPKEAAVASTAQAGAQAGADPAVESLFEDPKQTATATGADPGLGATGKPASDPSAAKDSSGAVASTNLDTLAGGGAPLTDPASPTDAQAFNEKSSFAGKGGQGGAILPKIPGRAITRQGTSLNRYYFLRSGDTPRTVSELIYGDNAKADQLKKWNKGRWIPGKVVYYASPAQPDDAQMVSFYDEKNLTPEDYVVGRGESMSVIAKKKLGSVSSWKELAIVNGLSSPDAVHKGQTIKIFTNLGSAEIMAGGQGTLTQEPMTPPPVVTPPPNPMATQPPAAMGMANPLGTAAQPDPANPLADDLSQPKKKPKKEGLNPMKLLTQNAFTLAMGLGIVLLLISLMMINKRKRTANLDEFNEDAFAPPGKKKRS